jgi:adenylate cyclase
MCSTVALAAGLASAVLAGCALTPPTDPEPLTTLVVFDDASIATLGKFPVPRTVYARAIEKARELGARGVALKFFIETGTPQDEPLEKAFLTMPVVMQFEPSAHPSVIPPSVMRRDWYLGATPSPLQLNGIVPPIPRLAARAAHVGFVNVRTDGVANKVEVAGRVGTIPIGSFQVETVELALGTKATVRDNHLSIAGKEFALDDEGRVACPVLEGPDPVIHGIDELLDGTIPESDVRGKVVVLGYGRSDSPVAVVDGARYPIHALFYRQITCLSRLVTAAAAS